MNQVWVRSIWNLLFQLFLTQKVRNERHTKNGQVKKGSRLESMLPSMTLLLQKKNLDQRADQGFCHVQSRARESQKRKTSYCAKSKCFTRDHMVQKFLLALRSRGVLITSVIAVSVAKALIARNPHLMLDDIDRDSSSWAKKPFRRMAFKKRMKTTGKIEIPDGAKKEAQLLCLHDIVSLVDEHNIPDSLILNLDQTKLRYIPSANHTLVKKGSKSIGIAG